MTFTFMSRSYIQDMFWSTSCIVVYWYVIGRSWTQNFPHMSNHPWKWCTATTFRVVKPRGESKLYPQLMRRLKSSCLSTIPQKCNEHESQHVMSIHDRWSLPKQFEHYFRGLLGFLGSKWQWVLWMLVPVFLILYIYQRWFCCCCRWFDCAAV